MVARREFAVDRLVHGCSRGEGHEPGALAPEIGALGVYDSVVPAFKSRSVSMRSMAMYSGIGKRAQSLARMRSVVT